MDMDFIPLKAVNRGRPDERQAMRFAVVQVLKDLLIARVPDSEKVEFFGRAYELLDLAGWSLDELFDATEPGPRQDHLFEILQI